jgi:hypothetical protein
VHGGLAGAGSRLEQALAAYRRLGMQRKEGTTKERIAALAASGD